MKTKFSKDNLLSSAVLVLNANYSPMTVCTAKRAISLYFLDKIDILSNYDESISSPSLSLELPSVIKIRTYVKNNNTESSRKDEVTELAIKVLFLGGSGRWKKLKGQSCNFVYFEYEEGASHAKVKCSIDEDLFSFFKSQ